MKIIISPAKNMQEASDVLVPANLPTFIDCAEEIKEALLALPEATLQQDIWKCNDAIAALNIDRLSHMNLKAQLTPALLAYVGLQYQYMAPQVFETHAWDYVQAHLVILSGFYGALRPLDGVRPYRLEMQAKLSVAGCKNLYDYWSDSLYQYLTADCDIILNLASKEYSKAIEKHVTDGVQFVTCTFGSLGDYGKIKVKATDAKAARGEMVRFLAENNVRTLEGVKAFDRLSYRFCLESSNQKEFVFLK